MPMGSTRENKRDEGGGDAEPSEDLVVGTTQLFEGGRMRYIPMPTANPKDPLNLPEWRKWAAIASLCFFGSLALAAEKIIGALIPVFVLEYAGIDPKLLGVIDIGSSVPSSSGSQGSANPLDALSVLGGPPVSKTALLSTLPLLINGCASYLLVPLSIAVGRRPVLLFSGAMAWVGGLWAGLSTSLDSHLAARAFQGFGAGAVEGLIPLIVQDFMFIHQRNRAIATVHASQGLIIVTLGIASPFIVERLSWRYVYYITTAGAFAAWIGLIVFVPETRWIRSNDELAGKDVNRLLRPGKTRPSLDYMQYGRRTMATDFGVFNTKMRWRLAAKSVWDTMRTIVFPNVLWVTVLTAIMEGAGSAATQAGSTVLIASGWKFETLGLAVVPLVVATPFVLFFGGYLADHISNWVSRRDRHGRREPEAHLLSLVVPLLAAVAGPLVFGNAAARVSGLGVLAASFLSGFGGTTTGAVSSVYLVESYPNFAGPVLVTVSSLRLILGFLLSFRATDWVRRRGFMTTFGSYSAALTATALLLPLMYVYGRRIRAFCAGRLEADGAKKKRGEFDEEEKRKAGLENKLDEEEESEDAWSDKNARVHVGMAL